MEGEMIMNVYVCDVYTKPNVPGFDTWEYSISDRRIFNSREKAEKFKEENEGKHDEWTEDTHVDIHEMEVE